MKQLRFSQRLVRASLFGLFRLFLYIKPTFRFQERKRLKANAVIASFHDELIAVSAYFSHQDMVTIASQSHLGSAIAKVLERMGFDVVLGSSSKGGSEAIFQLLQAARKGRTIVLTVDGSRGPRHKMKPGAVLLARKVGMPLYLVRASYPGVRLMTWDRLKLCLPFAKVDVQLEEFDLSKYPIDTDIDVIIKDAQERMIAMGRERRDRQAHVCPALPKASHV